jgi:ATP-binding cassette subfamily F protein uup
MSQPPLLSLRDVTVGFGGAPLFQGIEMHLARGERASLVGRNGSGKTTLMKVIVGAIEADRGEIYREPGLSIEWLEQEPRFAAGRSVRDFVAAGGRADYRVDQILAELGLDGGRDLASLSGGEGRRAALARVFAEPPDLLLLDEPTNHLDLSTIEWLERRLIDFAGAVLVISHDRTFLANITNRIVWLDRGRIRVAARGFAHFEDWREEVLALEERALEKLDSKLADETRWLLRGVTARRRRDQGRLARLERMRAFRATLIGRSGKPRLEAKETEARSKLVIEAEGVSKSLGEGAARRTLIEDFSTLVLRGDRLGIVGPNGAGKSTLLKLFIGELSPDRGTLAVARNLAVAYFDQKREQLDPKKSLREILCPQGGDQVSVQGRPRHVRAYLKDFLFDPRQADMANGALSGGERNRLLLAKILATPADLLVLDEPTNDLDTDTLDLLEDVLGDFGGTLLLVSHDRDFLDRIVTSTIIMPGDGTAIEYAGGYKDAMAQRRGEGAAAAPRKAAAARPAETRARQRKQLSYKDQRELDGLPAAIAARESEIAALQDRFADGGFFARDAAGFARAIERLEAAKQELAAAEDRWLELEALRLELEGEGAGAMS